jgi:hypothetical protein
MQTSFKNLAELKKQISVNQEIYLENHILSDRSRVTKVKNKQSYFFTIENNEGKESWIINGAVTLKDYGFTFEPDFERVRIYYKKNDTPFVTLHFNNNIINGKK